MAELGKYIDFKNGKKRPTAKGGYPVYGGNGVIDYVNEFNFNNGIVIGRVGVYCGSVFLPKDRYWVSDNAISATPKENADLFFAYYLLKSLKLNDRRIGTSQPLLTQEILNRIEVEIPSIDVQRKIGNILYKIDEKIKANEQINNNLYHILMLSFKHNYWNITSSHPDWSVTTLDNATARFGTGLNPRKNFVLGQGNNYYVTIKNMSNNRIFLDDRCDKINDEALKKIQKRSDLQVGDLLFSGIGTIGRVYLIDKPAVNWNTSESVFNLRPNHLVSSEFLYLLLLNDDMQEYAISLASGSVQKGIRMADLKRYKFALPSRDFMIQLTALWRPMIQQIKANEYENDHLANLRDVLLPKLMSGEIDVSDVEF